MSTTVTTNLDTLADLDFGVDDESLVDSMKSKLQDSAHKEATAKALKCYLSTDPKVLAVKRMVLRLAPTNFPVLIVGETGTGKELIARALHGARKGAFIAVNTPAVSAELLESSYFGAVRGAYTGCDGDRRGYVDAAADGTLFLDEIGDMPPSLQCKMLRFLNDGTYMRVGGNEVLKSTARIVAATNQLQLHCIKSFRKDLYYRLAKNARLYLPPLRSRPHRDLELIIDSFGFSKRADRMQIYEYLVSRVYVSVENSKAKDTLAEFQAFTLGNVRSVVGFLETRLLYREDEPIEDNQLNN